MDAEAEGIRNVGPVTCIYLKHLRCGKVNPAAAPKIVRPSESTTMVDADFACHHAYVIAEERLIETTRAQVWAGVDS